MARDYKKEYQQALKIGISGPGSLQHERQRARRMVDKTGKDANGNGKLDTFAGIPREGYGFSRNPPFRPRAPRWEEAVFSLPGESAAAIKLRNLF